MVPRARNKALRKIVKLSQSLTFRSQHVLRSIEDEMIEEFGCSYNVLKLNRENKRYTLLSSIPFAMGRDPKVDLSAMWPSGCTDCDSVVFRRTMPTGNLDPTYMFVGDAPGIGDGPKRTLDRALVYGPSSHLLRKATAHLGIYWHSWFTNLLKCALLNNRPSQPEEIASCSKYLRVEVEILKPEMVILLGSHTSSVVRKDIFGGCKIVNVKHPAYFARIGHDYKEYANEIRGAMSGWL